MEREVNVFFHVTQHSGISFHDFVIHFHLSLVNSKCHTLVVNSIDPKLNPWIDRLCATFSVSWNPFLGMTPSVSYWEDIKQDLTNDFNSLLMCLFKNYLKEEEMQISVKRKIIAIRWFMQIVKVVNNKQDGIQIDSWKFIIQSPIDITKWESSTKSDKFAIYLRLWKTMIDRELFIIFPVWFRCDCKRTETTIFQSFRCFMIEDFD